MLVSKKNINSLIDTVTLPFEQFIINDERLVRYLSNRDVAKIHNMAITKLSVYIYADINRAYELIQKGAEAHKKEMIPIENLKEFYTLYFELCKQWKDSYLNKSDNFGENLRIIEQFVYESFAKEDESKDEFFMFNSDEIKKDLNKMHYKNEEKISAKDFYDEGSIDEHDVQDILECSHALLEAINGDTVDYDRNYFNNLKTQLDTFAVILERNLEFKDLGFSLSKLSQFLEANIEKLITHDKQKSLLVILNAITEDLLSWTQSVLVEKTAIDVHFLDASLLSSIIQFEMMLAPVQDDDNDLEFF
jgi:hypothetical protein